MARKPSNSLQSKTDRLLGALMDKAIAQSSAPRDEVPDPVSVAERMSIAEMRMLAETSMRWMAMKAKLAEDEPEPESEFERILRSESGRTARPRRGDGLPSGDAAPTNGAATDAEVVDASH